MWNSFGAVIFCLFDQGLNFRDVFPPDFNGGRNVLQFCGSAVLRSCSRAVCSQENLRSAVSGMTVLYP